MRQVVFPGDGSIQTAELEPPRAVDDWAVIRVAVAPLCTEYKAFYAGDTGDGSPTPGIGHESAGEVVDAGPHSIVKPGDRVVMMVSMACGRCAICESGHYMHCEDWRDYEAALGTTAGAGTVSQYVARPSFLFMPVPEDVSLEMASLAGCGLGPSFGALQKLNAGAFDTVLITGLGPVGLGGVVNARFRGTRVIGVDPAPWQAQRALEMGAVAVIDPTQGNAVEQVRELTAGHGADYAIECSGSVAAQRLCIDATRRLGGMAFVGVSQEEIGLSVSRDLLRTGLTLVGNWHFNRQDYGRLLQVIRRSDLLDLLVSHRFPMSRLEEAFARQRAGETAKVLIDPWN